MECCELWLTSANIYSQIFRAPCWTNKIDLRLDASLSWTYVTADGVTEDNFEDFIILVNPYAKGGAFQTTIYAEQTVIH